MIEDYLKALRESPKPGRMSNPIMTKEGVDFRAFIGRKEMEHLAAYRLPESDTFQIVTKDWLRQQIGEERYTAIFGDE